MDGLFDPETITREPLRSYASGGYAEIGGWGINDFLVRFFLTLDAYQGDKRIRGNLIEIGVYEGKVTILLGLMARTGERVVAVDLFEPLAERNIDASGPGATRASFEANLARYGLMEKCDVIGADSLFMDFAPFGKVRFAHIDGAHYVDAIVNDLMKIQSQMVAGGIVVVDDYSNSLYVSVREGCDRFLAYACPRLVVPFAVGCNKLFLTTHSHHAELVQYVRQHTGRPVIRLHGFAAVSVMD